MSEQQAIYQATHERGYTAGLTREQFALRQVAKLYEEADELVAKFAMTASGDPVMYAMWWRFTYAVEEAGRAARDLFEASWSETEVFVLPDTHTEAADCAVVLANLAQALGFDLMQEAREKAEADVVRGVRGVLRDVV